MPGKAPPLQGIGAFHSLIDGLRQRLVSLESWQRQSRAVVPGTITQWGGAAPPPGALLCNGASFSAAQYPALFAMLGGTTLPTISTSPITVIWT